MIKGAGHIPEFYMLLGRKEHQGFRQHHQVQGEYRRFASPSALFSSPSEHLCLVLALGVTSSRKPPLTNSFLGLLSQWSLGWGTDWKKLTERWKLSVHFPGPGPSYPAAQGPATPATWPAKPVKPPWHSKCLCSDHTDHSPPVQA